jgi:hypothetical protein
VEDAQFIGQILQYGAIAILTADADKGGGHVQRREVGGNVASPTQRFDRGAGFVNQCAEFFGGRPTFVGMAKVEDVEHNIAEDENAEIGKFFYRSYFF